MAVLPSRVLPWAVGGLLVVAAACGGSGSSSGRPEGPQFSEPASDVPTDAEVVDIDAIFPAGPGRDLLLNNCQNCHVWVPIVILQMDEDAWYRNSLEHRDRVESLTDEDFETLYDYLTTNFTPDTPVPELPAGLLEAWTGY